MGTACLAPKPVKVPARAGEGVGDGLCVRRRAPQSVPILLLASRAETLHRLWQIIMGQALCTQSLARPGRGPRFFKSHNYNSKRKLITLFLHDTHKNEFTLNCKKALIQDRPSRTESKKEGTCKGAFIGWKSPAVIRLSRLPWWNRKNGGSALFCLLGLSATAMPERHPSRVVWTIALWPDSSIGAYPDSHPPRQPAPRRFQPRHAEHGQKTQQGSHICAPLVQPPPRAQSHKAQHDIGHKQ